jgi:hemerythrin-like domain-containing protein
MSDPSSTPPVTSVDTQILAEHRRIRELARQMEETTELRELLVRVGELRALLIGHFLVEEAEGGLYDTIRSMAPRQLGRVAQLEREHQTLVAAIDAVVARAHACLAGPVAEVLRQASEIARTLRSHEAAEDDIMIDTLYTDLGQGD